MRRFNPLCALLVRCVVVAGNNGSNTGRWYSTSCERPVPRTGLSRTPSLSSTTLSATARSAEHLIRLTCAVAYSCADSILFVPY